jgi:hypothetical protein
MILEKFLSVVEEVDPDLFEELDGKGAQAELDELKMRADQSGVILVNGETVADMYTVTLEERTWKPRKIIECTEAVIFIELKTSPSGRSFEDHR